MDENNQEFTQETTQETSQEFSPPIQTQPTPPPANSGGNLAVAALVCGILGLVGSFIPVVQYFTLVLAILGIVFGVKARKTAPQDKRGMATAGMILGIISVGLTILAIICVAACAGAVLSGMGGLGAFR